MTELRLRDVVRHPITTAENLFAKMMRTEPNAKMMRIEPKVIYVERIVGLSAISVEMPKSRALALQQLDKQIMIASDRIDWEMFERGDPEERERFNKTVVPLVVRHAKLMKGTRKDFLIAPRMEKGSVLEEAEVKKLVLRSVWEQCLTA